MPTYDLLPLLADRARNPQALTDALNQELIRGAVTRFNSEWGPRRMGRLTTEPIPAAMRNLIAFRGRLGLLIEHALAVLMDEALREDYADELRMSAEVVNQYPDFYLRTGEGQPLLRIDFKVLHDESAEYSARVTEPAASLSASDDFLLYAAWRWGSTRLLGTELRYPQVMEAIAVPALAIALERDRNLVIRGGHLEPDGTPIANSGHKDTNYGKINRIVHATRRAAPDLDGNVRAFLSFVERNIPRAEAPD